MMTPEQREAHRLYQRAWRERNRERCRGYSRAYAERNRSARRVANDRVRAKGQRLLAALKDKPCADCGVKYPAWVMDFDHRPGTSKRAVVSDLLSSPRLAEEAAKCDVVCANCHRERTHRRRRAGAK